MALEVLAPEGTDGYQKALSKPCARLVDLLWIVWQEHYLECTVSIGQTFESMGQSKVQAVKDADAGRSKDQPGKENESGLLSSLERCLKGYIKC